MLSKVREMEDELIDYAGFDALDRHYYVWKLYHPSLNKNLSASR